MEPHITAQAGTQIEESPNLATIPPEIFDLILDQLSRSRDYYKSMFCIVRTCRSLAVRTLPRLYSRDVADSLELPRKLDMPIALQWACWFGVLGTAERSLDVLAKVCPDLAVKLMQPFNNDNLYSLRYRMAKRRRAITPACGYMHWKNTCSLLHLACIRGNTAIAQLLISKGVHPNTLDGTNLPALAYALNPDVARLLIDHGADVNIKQHGSDETALCHIISWGPVAARKWENELNMSQGEGAVSVEHTIQDIQGTIRFLIQEAGADIYAEKIGTTNPLQNAVLTRHVKAVKLLLAAGASPNPIDTRTGKKRLLLADALKPGHNQEVVKLLLDAGAEADVDEDPYEGPIEHLPIMSLTLRGSNPLYAREEAQVAHMVCERVKNMDVVVDGHPALWHYVRAGRQDIGQVLIEHGADPQKANVEVRDTVLPLVALDI
ncbi:Nitrogen permease reactivator protein [Fusarium piperis]|uniref:Nitrogen permease reactivator protein n=1 Tax=Fusarium piperis TaxID=1435070 RepID=A0A9W8W7A7_9HYPO|nr:Nitrogen permease reactivator protein [Fusarium piperis]